MRETAIGLIMLSLLTVAAGGVVFSPENVGPLKFAPELLKSQNTRTIEPTSPILGHLFSEALRTDPRHPREILKSIKSDYPTLEDEIRLSTIAYLETMEVGLDDYCRPENAAKYAADRGKLTSVMTAAIPLEILAPFHQSYVEKIDQLKVSAQDPNFSANLARKALEVAERFQNKRDTCYVAQGLSMKQDSVKKLMPGRWDRLIDLNKKISSAEAPYPRIQFSINGLTQFVYNEIMKEESLADLLEAGYDAQVDWLRDARKGVYALPFFTFVERRVMNKGFTARQALLLLAYSMRNMPSLDIQYGRDPQKALELEVYFWKFNAIRDEITDNHLPHAFPDFVFKENPGFYHFATAALTACEVWSNGFSGVEARLLAFMGKFGYKVNKLMKQVRDNKTLRKRLLEEEKPEDAAKIETSIMKIAKEQGFKEGVQTGIFGGRHGLKACQFDEEARAKRAKAKPEVDRE